MAFAACGLCGVAWQGDDAIEKLVAHYKAAHKPKPKEKP
jgi:hypothetical protein